jgi:hypothetical protein
MKAVTWKAVSAAMSASPVLEAIAEIAEAMAEFAEVTADERRREQLEKTDDSTGWGGSSPTKSYSKDP